MGYRRPRRPHLALREPALAPAGHRTTLTSTPAATADGTRATNARTTAPPGIRGSTGMPGTTNISRPLNLRLNSYLS